jgi:hypothetical protein
MNKVKNGLKHKFDFGKWKTNFFYCIKLPLVTENKIVININNII